MDGKTLLKLALFFILVGFGQFIFIRSLWNSNDLPAAKIRYNEVKNWPQLTRIRRIFADLLLFLKSVAIRPIRNIRG
jgi:hypothetical protein